MSKFWIIYIVLTQLNNIRWLIISEENKKIDEYISEVVNNSNNANIDALGVRVQNLKNIAHENKESYDELFESYSGSLDELGSKFRNIRENLKYLSYDDLDIEKLRIFGGPINYSEQKQEFSNDQVEDKEYNITFQIWDLAGQGTFNQVRSMYYRGVFGALVVFDVTRKNSFDNLSSWIKELYKNSFVNEEQFFVSFVTKFKN